MRRLYRHRYDAANVFDGLIALAAGVLFLVGIVLLVAGRPVPAIACGVLSIAGITGISN